MILSAIALLVFPAVMVFAAMLGNRRLLLLLVVVMVLMLAAISYANHSDCSIDLEGLT